uniref:Uncharacterized protein n=1 Tax=Siphoviridae sp. ctiJI15 TaxID=2826431 RepID=A0A8S5NJG9_9CAUD|nr:MAG TPA: hypothetical protein [Siphoviridae sp. ctiJI15]
MGTTAEKLKYLNETKAEIKNALETPYNVMRDYPELIKKYIDNQPTKVVTDGMCGNAVDVPVKAIEINGNIRQETTEGYNLLNVPAEYTMLSTENHKEVPISLKANTKYTIKIGQINTDNTDVTKVLFRFRYNKADISNPYAYVKLSDLKLVYTPASDVDAVWIYSGNGYNESAKTNTTYKNLMIYEGTDDKSYEPYTGGIPSPSPDYPQEITNVGGYDNLFDKNNIISGSYVSDGNGTFVSNSTSKRTDYIEIQANSYYYIYSDKTSGNWGAWYDKDKKFISGITLGGQKEGVVNSPANAKYIAFTISYQGNLTDYSKIKINETAIKIKHSGKNLFNFNGVTNPSIATYESGIATLTWDRGYNVYFLSNSRQKLTDIDSKKTYTVIFKHKGNSIKMFNYATSQYGVSTKDDNEYAEYKFIITGVDFIELNAIRIATSGTAYIKEIMLYEGTDEASYESYHEPIITPINLQGNILSKVRDVKDILKIRRDGRVTITKNIGKVTFVGDDTYAWNISNSSITGLNAFWILISKYKQLNWKQKAQTKLSNYFKYYKEEWKQVTEPCICENTDLKPDMCIFSGFDSNMSLTKWKEWLSQHPTEVYYELDTPQTIILPSISPIELWQGTNIFSLVTNLDTDFEVEYVVDKDSVTKEEE